MTAPTASVTHRHDWLLTICPVTQTQVMGHIQRGFYTPENQEVWWYCPTCQGWHIIRPDQVEPAAGSEPVAS